MLVKKENVEQCRKSNSSVTMKQYAVDMISIKRPDNLHNMQQYAATSAFLNEKPLLLFPNTKILLNLIILCKTEQPFCKYRICSIFSLYAANMQHYAASPAF